MTEKTTKHYTLTEWESTWMGRVENALFISATNKEISEESLERVYEAVRHCISRTTVFISRLQRRYRKKTTTKKLNNHNWLFPK
jgi:hypothetical protein